MEERTRRLEFLRPRIGVAGVVSIAMFEALIASAGCFEPPDVGEDPSAITGRRGLEAGTVDEAAHDQQTHDAAAVPAAPDPLDTPQNFYFIDWRGTAGEAITYARQMGHRYVTYRPGMENEPLAKSDDVHFYYESPEFKLMPVSNEIDFTGATPPEQKSFAEDMGCWRGTDPYPMNLATGWPRDDHTSNFMVDWQQQRVIDYFVDRTIAEVKRVQAANPHMKFAGLAWDEANLGGDFQSHSYSRSGLSFKSTVDFTITLGAFIARGGALGGMSQAEFVAEIQKVAAGEVGISDSRLSELVLDPKVGPLVQQALPLFNPKGSFPVTISYWTKNGSCVLHDGIKHDYPTYTDGLAAWFKTVVARVRAELNPNAKWMIEPYKVYFDWMRFVETRPDGKDLIPDMMRQESGGLAFAEDKRILGSKLLPSDNLGSSAPNDFSEEKNRIKGGTSASQGLWWNWFGRFGGSTDIPNYKSLTEVPARLKLIRMVPTWDNLASVPLDGRSWNGSVYESPNSFVSSSVIASRHPRTHQLFIAFLTRDGSYALAPGERVRAIHAVDGLFVAAGDGASEVTVDGGTIHGNEKTKLDAPNAAYIVDLE